MDLVGELTGGCVVSIRTFESAECAARHDL